MLQNIGSTTPSWTDKNVVKFYFNGDIYVQNNNKIIEFNVNNHFPKEVATDVNELLGVDENNVYYTVKTNYMHRISEVVKRRNFHIILIITKACIVLTAK